MLLPQPYSVKFCEILCINYTILRNHTIINTYFISKVFDARDVTTARGMFDMICKHIRYATGNGNIKYVHTFLSEYLTFH